MREQTERREKRSGRLKVELVRSRSDGTDFSEEPSDEVTENDSLVGLVVVGRRRDTSYVPEICFPLVETSDEKKSRAGGIV